VLPIGRKLTALNNPPPCRSRLRLGARPGASSLQHLVASNDPGQLVKLDVSKVVRVLVVVRDDHHTLSVDLGACRRGKLDAGVSVRLESSRVVEVGGALDRLDGDLSGLGPAPIAVLLV
jgi:hypothetical protein